MVHKTRRYKLWLHDTSLSYRSFAISMLRPCQPPHWQASVSSKASPQGFCSSGPFCPRSRLGGPLRAFAQKPSLIILPSKHQSTVLWSPFVFLPSSCHYLTFCSLLVCLSLHWGRRLWWFLAVNSRTCNSAWCRHSRLSVNICTTFFSKSWQPSRCKASLLPLVSAGICELQDSNLRGSWMQVNLSFYI